MDKDRLLLIAQDWAYNQIDNWIGEYGSWDYIVECEELAEEDLEWIQENTKFIINVEEIKNVE